SSLLEVLPFMKEQAHIDSHYLDDDPRALDCRTDKRLGYLERAQATGRRWRRGREVRSSYWPQSWPSKSRGRNTTPARQCVCRHSADTDGSEPGRRRFKNWASAWFCLAPRAGFEPATIRLTVGCSTAELPRNRRHKCSQAASV